MKHIYTFENLSHTILLILIVSCMISCFVLTSTACAKETETNLTAGKLLKASKNYEPNSIYIYSDDPINYGREYIENSPNHTASATGSATLVDEFGISYIQDAELTQIKGRGNSTWLTDKKPYQIKFKKKQNAINQNLDNSAKTYVLLANMFDDSLLKNYLAYNIAFDSGLSASPECKLVNLYYDNEYRGLYLLSEKVQINSGRVDITEIENESTTDVDLEKLPTAQSKNSFGYRFQYVKGSATTSTSDTGGYLLEIDNANYLDERSWFSTSIGHVVVKSPEDATYEQMKYISEYFQTFINEASDPNGDISKYIDVESLAKYYLVNELAKNSDYMRYSSTYFYKDVNSTLFAGPVWDFDLSFGIHKYEGYGEYISTEGLTDPEHIFFIKNKMFIDQVKISLPQVINAAKEYTEGSKSIRNITFEFSDMIQQDENKWGNYNIQSVAIVKFKDHFDAINYLNSWLTQRISWVENNIVQELEEYSNSNIESSTTTLKRLWGISALDTMEETLNEAKNLDYSNVILVTSEGHWDALTASGLAGLLNAPIIMTNTNYLSPQAKNLLEAYTPNRIIVCGGSAAVSDKVAEEAMKVSKATMFYRCWGNTAVETAEEIYKHGEELSGKQWSDISFLCTASGYHDALASAPISYSLHIPILLTRNSYEISPSTIHQLKTFKATYIIGGSVAISDSIESNLINSGVTISNRLSGQTSVETAIEVAKYGINRGLSVNNTCIATTNGYWDALSGASLCGNFKSVLLLTPEFYKPALAAFLLDIKNQMKSAYVLGGTAAISDETYDRLYTELN